MPSNRDVLVSLRHALERIAAIGIHEPDAGARAHEIAVAYLAASSSDNGEERGARFVRLTEDRHQQALYRLAAVEQYLYDTMNGDEESDRDRPDPLPSLSMEHVRAAQVAIHAAIKVGQRTRRECLGGQIELSERRPAPVSPSGSGETVASLRAELERLFDELAEVRKVSYEGGREWEALADRLGHTVIELRAALDGLSALPAWLKANPAGGADVWAEIVAGAVGGKTVDPYEALKLARDAALTLDGSQSPADTACASKSDPSPSKSEQTLGSDVCKCVVPVPESYCETCGLIPPRLDGVGPRSVSWE